MQSQGSTSSQPSFDSMSSSDSLLFSDSEQDDTDVFLTDSSSTGVIGGGGRATGGRAGGLESPGSQWACDGFTDKEEEDESSCKAGKVGLDETDPPRPGPKSQGDILFAQKCAELRGFVRPLLELLNGLKTGRFERGLSSFQQSVAMDRIQRIVGVLQRPNSGERYLNTLLQVEMMLKLWFPHISSHPVSAASSTPTSPARSQQDAPSGTPPHKHRDQLHIPVKKRRLSWTGADSPTPSPGLPKCPRTSTEEKSLKINEDGSNQPPPLPPPPPPPSSVSDTPPSPPDVAEYSRAPSKGTDGTGEEPGTLATYKSGHSSEPSLTWVHVAPILSPRKTCPTGEGAAGNAGEPRPAPAAVPPGGRRGSPATQDSAVSSTTPYKHPKPLKKPLRCQSPPVGEQQSPTAETHPGQSRPSPPSATPSHRVSHTPLET